MKKYASLFSGLAVLLSLTAAPLHASGQGIPINLGLLPVIDTLPIIVAKEKGFFAEQGIDLRVLNFASALERDTALQSGKLDGCFGDLLNTLLLINSGRPLSVVTTVMRTDPGQRMFALVASPHSKLADAGQLRGGQVAVSRASIIEYVLDAMLAQSGVRPDTVGRMEVRAIPIRYQMLMADQVKAALLPEPLATKAELEGARVLADDRRLDTTLTVVALRSDLIRRFPGLGARFDAAYDKAVRLIDADPAAFMDIIASRTQFPASLKGRFKPPVFPQAARPKRQDVLSIEKWLKTRGLIAKPIPYETVVAGDASPNGGGRR